MLDIADLVASRCLNLTLGIFLPVVQISSKNICADVVSDAVDIFHRVRQTHLNCLGLKDMLAVDVSDFTGLADQGGVDEVFAGDLFVEVLKAKKKGTVAKSRHHSLSHPLEIHIAGLD
jgi:hypothetical protein